MRSHFYNLNSWYDCNDRLLQLWQRPENETLQLFPGVQQALMETLLGLSKQFIIKRKLIYVKELERLIQTQLHYLAIEGFDLVAVAWQDMQSDEWLSQLDDKVLAVVLLDDLPLVAKDLASVAIMDKVLLHKTLCIHLSFNSHFFSEMKSEIHQQEIHLMSMNPYVAVGRFGERGQVASYFSKGLKWDWVSLAESLLLTGQKQDRNRVIAFENMRCADANPLLANNSRFYDRAVIYWEHLDASALRELLLPRVGVEYETLLTTTSLIYWQGGATMGWLKAWGFSDEQIRGCLIVAQYLLGEMFADALTDAYTELISLQSSKG